MNFGLFSGGHESVYYTARGDTTTGRMIDSFEESMTQVIWHLRRDLEVRAGEQWKVSVRHGNASVRFTHHNIRGTISMTVIPKGTIRAEYSISVRLVKSIKANTPMVYDIFQVNADMTDRGVAGHIVGKIRELEAQKERARPAGKVEF